MDMGLNGLRARRDMRQQYSGSLDTELIERLADGIDRRFMKQESIVIIKREDG